MVLGRKIGHGQYMTPLNFEVTRSKVKVTVAFYAKPMSAQYLEKFLSDMVLDRKVCHCQRSAVDR